MKFTRGTDDGWMGAVYVEGGMVEKMKEVHSRGKDFRSWQDLQRSSA